MGNRSYERIYSRNYYNKRSAKILEEEALCIQQEDEAVCRSIGEHALTCFKDGDNILTICNAGSIATAKYGTALAPFYIGKEKVYIYMHMHVKRDRFYKAVA